KDLPVGVHTPRKNKFEMFKKSLLIIKEYNFNPEKVLIDHISSSEMLREVLKNGFYAGISVNNSKLSINEARVLIEEAFGWNKNLMNRIMLNSDIIKDDISEYFPFVNFENVVNDDMCAVLGQTANTFFGLNKQ
ncbi:MAG: hypothetical protein KKF89_01025, partial [Nanoarchaeota archaeon]|nr:hypothetical protein [Nanoarchaeota archaeon]